MSIHETLFLELTNTLDIKFIAISSMDFPGGNEIEFGQTLTESQYLIAVRVDASWPVQRLSVVCAHNTIKYMF